jgi:putative toxin-antitoxin system antitoxin component (TIGR02293 family)
MSKSEIGSSKKTAGKVVGNKKVLGPGKYSRNVLAKDTMSKNIVATQLVAAHLTSKQKLSKIEIAEPEESMVEQLNKALQIYIQNTEFDDQFLTQISEISFTEFLSNKLLLVMVIRKGIPYSIFTLIQNMTPFTLNDWASYLDISSKSLVRYKQKDKQFKPSLTEKIIELVEVTNLGLEVFGENGKFRNWLETPNYALGNLKPFDLLRDSYGKEMIIGELTRIEHGILA